jgi:uncharacterized protein with von Willebrand factor type A (vWA) domain
MAGLQHGNSSQHALGNRLARRWIDFGRLLRRNGVETTSGQVRDLLRALPLLDLQDRDGVYYASRALLCARKEDLPRFDLVFRQFWGRTRQIIIPSDTGSLETPGGPRISDYQEGETRTEARPNLPLVERATLTDSEDGEDTGEGAGNEHLERVLFYSAQERLRHVDFANFTDEELAQARALLASWRWQPGVRRTRRLAAARRGRRLDFSRTVRRAMRTQGVPYTLAMKGPRRKPRPIVLLCDISGSMAPYTRMMLHFLHTLRRGVGHAEVFVFGTRLTRITRQLKHRDVDRALEEVSRHVGDWSGGTRLGDALRAFNTHWARRVLGQGAVVCIISDGWDRGDPGLLAAEMAHLQRMAFRLIWLNPLLGVEGYRPITRGMAAALPFVDDFLPANTLGSLEALAGLLTGLHLDVRPVRRQGSSVQVRDSVNTAALQAAPAFTVTVSKSGFEK